MAQELKFILSSLWQGKGVRDADKDLQGIKGTAAKAGQAFSALTKTAMATGTAFIGVGFAMKKYFEFGKYGASITQTGESFEFLMRKIGAAPDILEQLGAAAKGTITDLGMMESTLLLLAGTSDNLGKALIDAAPQLMEIAKAANKLNPSLGTTNFMYDSIARGIKRTSPLILDNLGIIVKIGQVQEDYAKSIGKTVRELTAEEKQLALLNGVLETGYNLVDQVGGNTDSLTDSFDRLETAATEVKQTIAQGLAPGLATAAEAVSLLLNWSKGLRAAFDDQQQTLRTTTSSYEEYIAFVVEAAIQAGLLNRGTQDLAIAFLLTGEGSNAVRKELEDLNIVSASYYDLLQGNTDVTDGWAASLITVESVMDGTKEKTEELAQGFIATGAALDYVAGLTSTTFSDIQTGVDSSIRSILDNIDFLMGGGAELVTAFEATKGALDAGLIPPEAAKTMFEDIELAVIAVKEQAGLITTTEATRQVRDEFNVAWSEAKTLIDEAKSKINEIPDLIKTRLEIEVAIDLGGGYSSRQGYASGGRLPTRGLAEVGERGAEFVWDGVVIPADVTRRLKGLGIGAKKELQTGGAFSEISETPSTVVNNSRRDGDTRVGEGMTVNINNQLDLRTFDMLMKEWAGL